jgi:hypothetical protein
MEFKTDVAYLSQAEELLGEPGTPANLGSGVHPDDLQRLTDVGELISRRAEGGVQPDLECRIIHPDGTSHGWIKNAVTIK